MQRHKEIPKGCAALVLVAMLLLTVTPALATIRYVKSDATGANDGTSWTDAYMDLQVALAAAVSGDEIWVATGTYHPASPDGDRNATFQLKNEVSVYGGFAGTEGLLSQRLSFPRPEPDPLATILSGDLNDDDINDPELDPYMISKWDNSHHVVTGSATTSTALLDGFTITAGYADGDSGSAASRGAGIYIHDGSPTITRCAVTSNWANIAGGGVFTRDGSFPTISDSLFQDNVTLDQMGCLLGECLSNGGAMTNSNSSPRLVNCVFHANGSTAGGAVFNVNAAAPEFVDCEFSANTAWDMVDWTGAVVSGTGVGGAMVNAAASVTATGCVFNGNYVGVQPGNATTRGGAIYALGSTGTYTNCVWVGNTARLAGGAMLIDGGSTVLTGCALRQNSASFPGASAQGGAIHAYGGSLQLTGCEFSGNSAMYGGGLFTEQEGNTLAGCTFTGNSTSGAMSFGGGAYFARVNAAGVSPTTIENCQFVGNASDLGGALASSGTVMISLLNSTFAGNSARTSGGGISSITDVQVEMTNCVMAGDAATHGKEMLLLDGSGAVISHSAIQGGASAVFAGIDCPLNWQGPNIDADPLLAADGHLLPGSPCLDAALAAGSPAADRDGETRPNGGGVDIGSDELFDSDNDRLPDWWELRYFGSATAAVASADTDGDGLTDLQEYERYGTDPKAAPLYVDGVNGNDLWNGLSPTPQSGGVGPKKTIQAAIDACLEGGTVVVLPGTYSGTGNKELDFGGKAIVVRSRDGRTVTTIDCGESGQAVNPDATRNGAFIAVEGFTILGGSDAQGTAIKADASRFVLRGSRLVGNTASAEGGGLRVSAGTVTVDGLILDTNGGSAAYAGLIAGGIVDLQGSLTLNSGLLRSQSSWFSGPGSIALAEGALLHITKNPLIDDLSPTICRSDISGMGSILIDPGQQLVLADSATVDLSGGGGQRGQITIDGSLVARDSAVVRNANVIVRQAEITTDESVYNNDIRMLDVIASGGEFFVQDGVQITGNVIHSVGDRYLDLDPDPDPQAAHPEIEGNTIYVEIETNPAIQQGTLLELRAKDYECSPDGSNPDCLPGLRHATVPSQCLDDPADNWVLETLEVKTGSRLNLTNRPGLDFHPEASAPDTVYVRNLILRQNAVLNTSFQTLYCESLTMEAGAEIVDEPLLGFSLGIIKMDDPEPRPEFNEFGIRLHKRLWEPQDNPQTPPQQPTKVGVIERLADARAAGDGVMEMKTQAEGKEAATSVAAKGSFARAGEENIVVAFEYQFINAGDAGDAEILVKLSDNQEVNQSDYEVARVRPPTAGLPGAVGGTDYAVFCLIVPYEQWSAHLTKFVRGTYVELELRGKGAVVRIDNFDPQVICRYECISYDGVQGVTEADYLVLLSEYGRGLGLSDPKGCLDSRLSGDRHVDLADLLAWDSLESGGLNSCSYGLPSAAPTNGLPPILPTGSAVFPTGGLVVTGKPNVAGEQGDGLYTLTTGGACAASGVPPAGGTNSRGNGRLIRDGEGEMYQIEAVKGLVRLGDGQAVVPPGSRASGGDTVYIGIVKNDPNCTTNCAFIGLPLNDAVFHPSDDTAVYVVPVLVSVPARVPPQCPATYPPTAHSYRAAAKLRLSTNQAGEYTGEYAVERLYGIDPYDDLNLTNCLPETSPYDVQRLREIEISRDGSRVLVSSAQELNGNNWLLIYNESTGAENRVDLDALSASLQSPIAMLASSKADKIYMGTSASSSGNSPLFRLSLTGMTVSMESEDGDGSLDITGMRYVTSVVEDPADGSLYVVGMTFDPASLPEKFECPPPTYTCPPIFTEARWSAIPAGTDWTTGQTIPSQAISGSSDLALPLSAVFVPGTVKADLDNDGDVDSDDAALFESCASGPAVARSAGCENRDFDSDNDVDQSDFAAFQRCYSGENVPADPDCTTGGHEPMPATLRFSNPARGESLWRDQNNIIRLTFDADIVAPDAGAVMIQEMIAGGTYGDDLSAGFTFTVENSGQGQPRVLKIRETGSSLQHRKWYAVRNTGAWAGFAPFTVQYVVQVGDANNDGRVLNTDFGVINAAIPIFNATDDDRRDINGDGRVLNTDFGVANSKIPSFTVAKPEGH